MPESKDDVLDPQDIDALLNAGTAAIAPGGSAAGGNPPEGDGPLSAESLEELLQTGRPAAGSGGGDLLSSSEIDSLLNQNNLGGGLGRAPAGLSGTEELLDRAQAGVAAAVAADLRPQRLPEVRLEEAHPFDFESFEQASLGSDSTPLQALQEVELDLRIELGRTQLLIDEVLKLREGSVVPLDKLAGDPVDILVNGRLIARGEVLVLNDNFCVRVAEILAPSYT